MEATSNVEVAGSKGEEVKLLENPLNGSPSNENMELAEEATCLVGDAKGLSGRLCCKLFFFSKKKIKG